MSRSVIPLAVLGACAVVVGGCGGGDPYRTDRPILRMVVDEYRIVPQDVVVKPGRMKFVVRNTGRLSHNLAVQIPEGPDGKPKEIVRTDTMQPGQTAPPIKVALTPGRYRLVCTILNHDDLGQFGTLEAQE